MLWKHCVNFQINSMLAGHITIKELDACGILVWSNSVTHTRTYIIEDNKKLKFHNYQWLYLINNAKTL